MRFPWELYQIEAQITQHVTDLRPAHALGLALCLGYGTVLAKSACLTAILIAVVSFVPRTTVRQRWREWLNDGRQNARPCSTHVDITPWFPAMLRWVVGWWQGRTTLSLAIDAVFHPDRVVAVVIRVLSRGCAIPIAWHILPAQEGGAWMPPILALVDHRVPAIPAGWRTVVLPDRGLGSPQRWTHVRKHRLHPLVRIADGVAVRPLGRNRTVTPARVVATAGHGWVGEADVCGADARQTAILIVIGGVGSRACWVLLTDLAPRQVQHR